METNKIPTAEEWLLNHKERFAALCLFAPCTKFQVTTNVDGANSTKPLLGVCI